MLACHTGANIIAIDINRPNVWKGLLEKVRRSCGTVTFPVDKVSLATQKALKGSCVVDYSTAKRARPVAIGTQVPITQQ